MIFRFHQLIPIQMNMKVGPIQTNMKLDTTTENSSEMVKFLAFIRKMGMDLL